MKYLSLKYVCERVKLSWVAGVVALVAAHLVMGCSLETPDRRMIRVTLPETQANTQARSSVDPLLNALSSGRLAGNPMNYANSGFAAPTAFTDFTCFGLNVVGPGIAPDPRMGCSNPTTPSGVLGGLAPVSGGSVEMQVPVGPARTVQVFAVQSSVGCPTTDSILNSMTPGGNGPPGIGDAYLLGEATVDVFDNTTVDIVAHFDPATSPKMFNCNNGQNHGAPPTLAYSGFVGALYPNIPIITPLVAVTNPTAPDGATEIGGVALLASQMAMFPNFISTPAGTAPPPFSFAANPASFGVMGTSGSTTGKRAVMQLQWDVSSIDLVANPFIKIDMQPAGGAIDSTTQANCYNGAQAYAGIYKVTGAGAPGWIQGGSSAGSNYLGWSSFSENATDLEFQKTPSGSKYVIVNVESNYVSGSTPNCMSLVGVAGAGLQYSPTPFQLQLMAPQTIAQGQTTNIQAVGGVKPYTYHVTGSGTIAPTGPTGQYLGIYTAGTQGTVDTITVTDSASPPVTASTAISIGAPPPSNVSVGVSPSAAEGTCQSVFLTFTPPIPGGSILNLSDSGAGGYFYPDSLCGAYSSGGPAFIGGNTSVSVATSSLNVYYRRQQTATSPVTFMVSGSSIVPATANQSYTYVGTPSKFGFPSVPAPTTCMPVMLGAQDTNGAPASSCPLTGGSATVSAGGQISFYTNSTCTTGAASSISLTYSGGCTPVTPYYMMTTAASGTGYLYFSTGSVSPLTLSPAGIDLAW